MWHSSPTGCCPSIPRKSITRLCRSRNGIWFGLPLLEEQGHRIQQFWPPGSPARLQIIEHAGHNPHAEQPTEVMQAVRDFISE